MIVDFEPFLACDTVIDWRHPQILSLADRLRHEASNRTDQIASTFRWVRDSIQHSLDFHRDEVTCQASEVLHVGTGFCYAKAHLLAALLRAQEIPVGFCYQRLSLSGDGPLPFAFMVSTLFLSMSTAGTAWMLEETAMDCQSAFTPPQENLPFQPRLPGEADLPEIWPAPLVPVVEALRRCSSVAELAQRLPDVPLIPQR